MNRKISDATAVIQSIKIILNVIIREQQKFFPKTKICLTTSSNDTSRQASVQNPSVDFDLKKIADLTEVSGKLFVIKEGLFQYTKIIFNEIFGSKNFFIFSEKYLTPSNLHVYDPTKDPTIMSKKRKVQGPSHSLNNLLHNREVCNSNKAILKYSSVKEKIDIIHANPKKVPKIKLSLQDEELLKKLEKEYEKNFKNEIQRPNISNVREAESDSNEKEKNDKISSLGLNKVPGPENQLSPHAKAKKVPSTRIGRIVSFGSLGVGLGIGTLAEYTRRSLGMKSHRFGETLDSMFLTKANAERIVSTLCKVRGAALKIGQILSIQDDTVISPDLQKAFERVRQSADFMPTWQVEKALSKALGKNWKEKLSSFSEKPFAAASIGQVHYGTLLDGKAVAIKIQYPGVAAGIQSDIDNLVGIMKVWNIFPEGLFIDNIVEVAKKELAWEVDYIREAECTKIYEKLVQPYPEYYVPRVIDNLCTAEVFTTEFVEGIPVDKCINMNIETKEHICKLIMNLCLKELFEFRYMQTDPNWSNFFYNPVKKQIILLDFGACRKYSKQFMDDYIEVIKSASEGDRLEVLKLSRKMGFLTGYESKLMENAHVNAIMILGQVFDKEHEYFDFGGQDVTRRIQELVPTIVYHRLCPPPEEIYSLHRKLSGVFLLCAKMNVRIKCRDMFLKVYKNYQFG